MSFGIEVWDDNSDSVFALGRKYIKIVGRYQAPGAPSTSILDTTFTIPGTVPSDEIVFVTADNDYPPLFYTLAGRTLTIRHRHTGTGSALERLPAAVFYGFYA